MKKTLLMLSVIALAGCKSLEQRLESKREKAWPPDNRPQYETNALGKILESEFQDHCAKCITDIPVNVNKSYIPREEDIRKVLKDQVESAKISAENLMFFGFTDSEKSADLSTVNFNPSKVLSLGLDIKFIVKEVEGFSGFYYSSNCSGYAKSTVTGSTKLPYAVLDGSVENDIEKSSTIVLIKGWFTSPITEILAGRPLEKNLLYSSLWMFYGKNPGLTSTSVNYLSEFNGYLLKRFSRSELKNSVGLAANVNVTVPTTNVNADVDLRHNITNLFKSNNWITIRSKEFDSTSPKESLFRSLPTLDQTIEYFATIQSIAKPVNNELLSVGKPHKHTHFFKGLPKQLSTDFWEIESVTNGIYDANASGLTIESKYMANEIGEYGCRIEIEGTPLATLFGPNLKPFYDIDFVFKSKNTIDGKHLKLKSRIRLNTSETPRIIKLDEDIIAFAKIFPPNNPNPAFMWNLNFLLDVTGSNVDNNTPPQVQSVTLSNGVTQNTTSITTVDSNLKKYKMVLNSQGDQPDGNYEAGTYDIVTCEITLKLRLNNGTFINKSFSNQIKYPKVKQASQLIASDIGN